MFLYDFICVNGYSTERFSNIFLNDSHQVKTAGITCGFGSGVADVALDIELFSQLHCMMRSHSLIKEPCISISSIQFIINKIEVKCPYPNQNWQP